MSPHRSRIGVLAALLMLAPVAGASGLGVTVGAPMSGARAQDTGVRERVELLARGGLLVGRPHHPSIELITIWAPGIEASHLILRDIGQGNGARSVLLAAPPALVASTRRATLYLRGPASNLVVIETIGGRSIRHFPQPVAATKTAEGLALGSELYAVPVQGLGPFRLTDRHAAESDLDHSARALLGSAAGRALLPLAAALLLLLLGRAASSWVHRLDRHAP